MEPDFIYWRHPSVPGIKIEEVSGGGLYNGKVRREMARQVWCENGREAYREIGHFPDGAPFIFGETARISITHCDGLFAVATLPSTPEVDLSRFSRRAAVGIDAERADRRQVLGLRERFLNDCELEMIPAGSVLDNIIAWTVKEAAYKAALTPGLDFRNDIGIVSFPRLAPPTPVFDPAEFGLSPDQKKLPDSFFGEVVIVNRTVGNAETVRNDSSEKPSDDGGSPREIRLRVYSYLSDECVVTLCYDPKCAKFGKNC